MADPVSLRACPKGLNFGLPLYRADDGYAVELANMIPRNGALCGRMPFRLTDGATAGASDEIPRWLHPYVDGTTTDLLSVDGRGRIIDAAATTILTTLSVAVSESVGFVFNNTLVMTLYPGAAPRTWNGTALATPAFTLPGAGPWSTLATTDITGGHPFKKRVWYWSYKTSEAIYTALDATAGVVSRFPLNTISKTGGNIKLITSLTMDGGGGADDLLVICLDTGETLIYQGTDPATDFEIIGRFQIPSPLCANAVALVGADTLICTSKGLIPINAYIKQGFGAPLVDWLLALNPEIESGCKLGNWNYAQIKHLQSYGLLILIMTGSSDEATANGCCFVMDTNSRAWTRFTSKQFGDSVAKTSYTFGGGGVGGSVSASIEFLDCGWLDVAEHDGHLWFTTWTAAQSIWRLLKYPNPDVGFTVGLVGSDADESNTIMGEIQSLVAWPFLELPQMMKGEHARHIVHVVPGHKLTRRQYGVCSDGDLTENFYADITDDIAPTANTPEGQTYNQTAVDFSYNGTYMMPYARFTHECGPFGGIDQAFRYESVKLFITPAEEKI